MSATGDDMAEARAAMMREVERSAREHIGRSFSPRVLSAIAAVPRHRFVLPEDLADAYRNRPLPIGYGQTISQPFIVALMSDLLKLSPADRVLEIGTGCGYQTAILARLAKEVFTVEICEPLFERAQRMFVKLGLSSVHARLGDGYAGWSDAGPFDAILVTAAPLDVPNPLVEQLKPGGRLVIPIGLGTQQLIVVEMRSDQSTVLREIIPVCFVPLTRQSDHSDDR